MAFLTDRKRAEGMGSGRQGTEHHWKMMGSSLALQIAIPAFVITFGIALGKSHADVQAYFAKPFPAIVLALSLVVILRHVMFEAVEAIEDYVHGAAQKIALIAVKGLSYGLIFVGLFAIARMAL